MSQLTRTASTQGPPPKRRKSGALAESPRSVPPPSKPSTPTLNRLVMQGGASFGYSRLPAKMTLSCMGSTGFAAILEENEHAGILMNSDPVSSELGPRADKDEYRVWGTFGTSVLAWLPTGRSLGPDGVLAQCYYEGLCWLEPHTQSVFQKRFWSNFNSLLTGSDKSEGLGRLSDILTANTRKVLPIPASNQDWIDSFTGENSRWELVGLMFATIGTVAFTMPEGEPLFRALVPKDTSKKSFTCSMLECADACLMLSEQVSDRRQLLQHLLLCACTQLQSMATGDTNDDLWMRLGTLAASVTGLGLHLPVSEEESRSSLYYQARTHGFGMAFGMDKFICTFTGRPPCLSRRFASVNLPLDVDGAVLYNQSSIDELQKTLSLTGWNLEGKLYHATEQRATYLLGLLRDEILELALTTIPIPNLSEQIDNLRKRMDETWEGFPAAIRVKIDKKLLHKLDKEEFFCIISLQLMNLHNIFLVERIEHPEKDEQRLLQAAREILSTVVLLWSERDRHLSFRDCIHWYLCCYGIPAGSALAIDLWKHTVSPLTNPISPYRASTIQNLSLFVVCLEWVGPDDGNYLLCGRASKVIQNILERALAPTAEPTLPSLEGYDLTNISLADMPAWGHELESWFDSNGWGGAMQY